MLVNKKLDRLKQWAGEKMGGEAKSAASDELKSLEAEMDLRYTGTKNLHKAMTTYMNQAKQVSNDELGSQMIAYGDEFEFSSDFGKSLSMAGRTHERLAREQRQFVDQATTGWLVTLEYALAQLKEYQTARSRLESKRLNYDTALTRMQKAKKEDSGKEEELRVQEAKYKEATEDVYRRIEAIRAEEVESIVSLSSFLDQEIAYHDECRRALVTLRNEWPASQYSADQGNERRYTRQPSTTSYHSTERRNTLDEEPPRLPSRPKLNESRSLSSSSTFTENSFRENAWEGQRQRPVASRTSTFDGRGDRHPANPPPLNRAPTDISTISATRSALRQVNKPPDTFADSSDSASHGDYSPSDARSVSPATSQGSPTSWAPHRVAGTLNSANKRAPPPVNRAKKPPPPPPPARR